MHIILFDSAQSRTQLMPFTFTRPISDIRVGILKIQEKWELHFKNVSPLTENYLQAKFPVQFDTKNCYVNSQCLPSKKLVKSIKRIKKGEAIFSDGKLVAFCVENKIENYSEIADFVASSELTKNEFKSDLNWLENRISIFELNRAEIISDFGWITKNRQSEEISDPHTIVYGEENIFVEHGAKIRASILNAEDAPIYIGKNAEVHEGSFIKGAFALCEGAHVNPGAKMRGDSTIGPFCKVGGEVSNSVFFGYSNKGHDGFVGNSVLGEWCNLGADTNTSNLKNNYGNVSVWNYETQENEQTDSLFCGLMMGDHSKCGINTMFNTGTVVGVSSNIFGADFPAKYIPSFAWGGKTFEPFKLEKAYEVAERMMGRRKVEFTDFDKAIFEEVRKLDGIK
ncbi:MAG: UDP-N-acetylglucosamine diphosphorylase/glucosamine-1-phosphate N-acetyltransferase [Flammeovirgaceae bacterium]|jgi:UDP-N-acetylglucosamine diphosphorylase/glucosamine-1-phosphate N-acetyltransferase